MNHRKVDPDTLRDLYLVRKMKVDQIAARLGVGRSTISLNITQLGLPKRSHERAPRLARGTAAVVRSMAEKGFGWEEIVSMTNLPAVAVRAEIEQAGRGVPLPGNPPSPPKEPVEEVPAHPFWTPERDRLVFVTKGSGVEISALAETWGKPIAFVMQRWHRIRVTH